MGNEEFVQGVLDRVDQWIGAAPTLGETPPDNPLPERSSVYPPVLPDKITIFSEPLIRDFQDPTELRKQIGITLIHEIAHYFGIDEKEIEDLGY